MSTVYHSQTDGGSEHMNKTLNQCIWFHIEHNQKGWVQALPLIPFNIMNAVNPSMGFSRFQLHMGCSLHVLPPLIPSTLLTPPAEEVDAHIIIKQLTMDEAKAKDVLLTSKITQAFCANKTGVKKMHTKSSHVVNTTLTT